MTVRTFRWAAASALAAALMFPAAAAADDLIVIPVSGFARGNEGDVVSIASVDVPAETIGATCQITGRTVNQVSVHEGNDLLIITNGQTFVVPNFEDAGFIEHEAGEVTSVGSTIELQIRFGPDGVSSGGFRVSVECDPSNFTTTTAPTTTAPTTTVPDITTTEAPTTTDPSDEEPPAGPTTIDPSDEEDPTTTETPETTVPVTQPSTTEVSPSTPTTEEPPAGPTTEPTTSTTAAPTTAPSTTAPPSTQPPTTSSNPPGLPVTGSSTGLIVGFGTALLAAGVMLRRYASAAA